MLLFAQDSRLNNYYQPPLTIPLSLSGNFCEIRTNHFHAGIDIRTAGKEGLPVLAAAAGYVSRIKVSIVGYGKALYITHPNGTVTVYGHLRQFADSIRKYVEEKQYAAHKFEIELFPDSTQFAIKQGEQIAWSGNSGGSEAPHLHFEIRDRYSEEPLNPLLLGLQVNDSVFPVLTAIALYEKKSGTYKRVSLEIVNALNDSVYAVNDTIRISNNNKECYLSFSAYDKAFVLDSNDVGIYAATLMNGFDTLYYYQYDRFNFTDSRYVNAHIDYEAKINHKIVLERCYRLPGDSFPEFMNSGNGIILLTDDTPVNLKLIVKDFAGHASTLLLEIAKDNIINNDSLKQELLPFNKEHVLKSANALLKIPKGNLYENLVTKELDESEAYTFYSPVIKVFDKTIPLHKSAELSIRCPKILSNLQPKILIASVNDQNKITGAIGGKLNDGWVKANIRSFGKFVVTVDTLPPVINQMQLFIDSVCQCIVLTSKLTDDLSGIETYNGYVDNKWVVMEYDLKSDRLLYYFKTETMGPHQLTIEAADAKQNSISYQNGY